LTSSHATGYKLSTPDSNKEHIETWRIQA